MHFTHYIIDIHTCHYLFLLDFSASFFIVVYRHFDGRLKNIIFLHKCSKHIIKVVPSETWFGYVGNMLIGRSRHFAIYNTVQTLIIIKTKGLSFTKYCTQYFRTFVNVFQKPLSSE